MEGVDEELERYRCVGWIGIWTCSSYAQNSDEKADDARTEELYKSTKEKMGEENAQIFLAYQMLLKDSKLYKGVNEHLNQGQELAQAIEEGLEELAGMCLTG